MSDKKTLSLNACERTTRCVNNDIKFYPRCFDITSIDRCRQSLINNSKYINISLLIYPDIDDKNISVV